MIEDCKFDNLEVIITKNISRFGRDTVEVLEALKNLRELGVRVIFEQEWLDTADTDSELMISIIESIAQTENEYIKWIYKRHVYRERQSFIIENVMAMKMIQMVS
ncbi:recombinase family protein [Shouchella clausii]|uniref:recombinase family protein n=1 Tax=Shouchella clausii TaxID=79880 RepID=UPI0031FD7A99